MPWGAKKTEMRNHRSLRERQTRGVQQGVGVARELSNQGASNLAVTNGAILSVKVNGIEAEEFTDGDRVVGVGGVGGVGVTSRSSLILQSH